MMRKFTILIITTLSIFISACSNGVTDDNKDDADNKLQLSTDEIELVKTSETFGLKLFRQIDKSDDTENIFISPLSVSTAFGMLLNGADNATYDSISYVLNFNGLTNEQINKSYKHLIQLLSTVDEEVLFEIANSIWYHNKFAVEDAFLNTNIEYYNAEISALNFADPTSVAVINNWVSDKTHQRIKKIIDRISPDDIMYLINAIYFKGTWTYQFNRDFTRDDMFYFPDGSSDLFKMMMTQARLNYYEDDELQIVELPYGDGHYSMLIFLPRKVDGLDDFVQSLDENRWQNYLQQLKPDSGFVEMPRFTIKYKLIMNKILKSMGMSIAFSSMADFSRINKTEQLAISNVIHKSFIKVDEEGTEAAAVTAIGVKLTSVGDDEDKIFYFYANHPFFYVIRERDSGAILFMGRMDRPQGGDE